MKLELFIYSEPRGEGWRTTARIEGFLRNGSLSAWSGSASGNFKPLTAIRATLEAFTRFLMDFDFEAL